MPMWVDQSHGMEVPAAEGIKDRHRSSVVVSDPSGVDEERRNSRRAERARDSFKDHTVERKSPL